jgi:hypoxanthine phosphoribosyltransferase
MPILTKLEFSYIIDACKKITRSIKRSKRKHDCIISIGRGGMVIARLLSELLDVRDVYIYDISGYGIHGEKKCLGIPKKYVKNKHALIVDDVIQTGGTIHKVLQDLDYYADIAVIAVDKKFHKEYKDSPLNGNTLLYFNEKYDGDNEWIVFPWENI